MKRALTKEEADEVVSDAARVIEVYDDFVQGVRGLQATTLYPSVQLSLSFLLNDLDSRIREIIPDEKIDKWEADE